MLANIPKTLEELRKVLGFVDWSRPYIPKLSEYYSPLFEHFKKKKFTWNEDMDQAWQKLWKKLSETVELSQPDYNRYFYLFADASSIGLAGILV